MEHHVPSYNDGFMVRDRGAVPSQPSFNNVPLITRYLQIMRRRKWTIAAATVVCIIAAILITLFVTPQYTATTQLEINRESARIFSEVENVQPETGAGDQEFYQTQYSVLASRTMAERVAQELRLANNAQFFETMDQPAIVESFSGLSSSIPQDQREKVATELLLANLQIQGITTSRLVDINWTSADPTLAAQVANTWGTSFIEYNLERRYDATSYAREFLQERLEQVRQRLEDSERELVGYAQNQGIISLPVGATDGSQPTSERSLTVDRLAALNQSYSAATADRIEAESRLQSARSGALPEQLSNPTVNALLQRQATLSGEYADMMSQFTSDYPPARQLFVQLEEVRAALGREQSRVAAGLRSTYNDAREREALLESQIEALRGEFLDQRRRGIQYNIFQREVDTNRELYDGLLQRLREISVVAGIAENNISVIDTAQIPTSPSFPRPFLNVLGGIVLGLSIGIALALAREQIDETIVDPADIERRLGLPVLGSVPEAETDTPLNELRDPKANLTEAYLSAQTALTFATDHGLPRSIVVTSTRPAEGKSTTAHAFAYLAARGGERVLLIDGDMRSPTLHKSLGTDNMLGLSAVLAGAASLKETIQKVEQLPFDAMTAGASPPSTVELLRGQHFAEMLRELQDMYDFVVIDAPPVMGLADAPIIASMVEATVFVTEFHGVKARHALQALERLQQAHARIAGGILTKLPVGDTRYGYGYDYGYGYGRKQPA